MMSTSGVGRGRGWLNLNKNNQTGNNIRPGIVPNHLVNEQSTENVINNIPTQQPTQYLKIINQIMQLDLNDDGILLNKKLKSIKDIWQQECKDSNEVTESFNYVYDTCLQNSELASKVVAMCSLNSFHKVEIYDLKLRKLFIEHLQSDFENCKQLQKGNINAFRISVRMLGEYFNKARLINGLSLRCMALPLLHYLETLLETAQPADLELFSIQFNLNGSALKATCPQKIDEILVKIRHVLVSNVNLTQKCKVWLLLSLDVSSNHFGLLPPELLKFYQEQLGEKAMAEFQGSHVRLSIQTVYPSKTLDSYQSNVSVLQVSSASTSPVSEQDSVTSNNNQLYQNTTQNFNTSQNYSSDSSLSIGTWDSSKDKPVSQEKAGRPILGAGARLNKSKSAEGSSGWKDQGKENSAGWSSKQKNTSGSGWGGNKNNQSGTRSNKGWEHDDRFETDYN